LALPEIQAKVFEIEKETKVLAQEVDKLLAFAEIQEGLNSIGEGVDNLSQEIQTSGSLTGFLCLK